MRLPLIAPQMLLSLLLSTKWNPRPRDLVSVFDAPILC